MHTQHGLPSLASPFLFTGIVARKPAAEWDQGEVLAWLDVVGLQALRPHFEAHQITGDMLLELNNADLEHEMSISSIDHRQRLIKEISTLRHGKVRDEPKLKCGTKRAIWPGTSFPPAKRRSGSPDTRRRGMATPESFKRSATDREPSAGEESCGPVLLSQVFVELFNNNLKAVEGLLKTLLGLSPQYKEQVRLLLRNLHQIDPGRFFRLITFLSPSTQPNLSESLETLIDTLLHDLSDGLSESGGTNSTASPSDSPRGPTFDEVAAAPPSILWPGSTPRQCWWPTEKSSEETREHHVSTPTNTTSSPPKPDLYTSPLANLPPSPELISRLPPSPPLLHDCLPRPADSMWSMRSGHRSNNWDE